MPQLLDSLAVAFMGQIHKPENFKSFEYSRIHVGQSDALVGTKYGA